MILKSDVKNVFETLFRKNPQDEEFLHGDTAAICQGLQKLAPEEVFEWAFEEVKKKLCSEVYLVSNSQYGLHFNISKATASNLDGGFMQKAGETMRKHMPWVWNMMSSLLDANPVRKRAKPLFEEDSIAEMLSSNQEELGEIGEDAPMDIDPRLDADGNMDVDANPPSEAAGEAQKTKKTTRRAAKRNAALIMIKNIVCISIFLQSTNENCNYLQSVLGLFYHSASVPEKVIETLAHAGLSVGLSSIHSGIKSLSQQAGVKIKEAVRTLLTALAYDNFESNFKTSVPTVQKQSILVSATSATAVPLFGVTNPDILRCSDTLWQKDPRNPSRTVFPVPLDMEMIQRLHLERSESSRGRGILETHAWHIRDILIHRVPGFKHFEGLNGNPKTVNQIPLHKTSQIPCRAMKIKESTTDGNVEVVENLLRQGGIGDPRDRDFNHETDIDMSEFVILIHGDLLTKERLESVQDSRRIEDTPKRRFQFPIIVPGLFHFKMAAADAIWRIWVQPPEGCTDNNSLVEHAGILRPKEMGKFTTKPGFRRVHDVIHHDIWASMLDCWKVEAKRQDPSWDSLENFAKGQPTWETLVAMSEYIANTYVATIPMIAQERKKPPGQRDQVFENQILRNRDELFYLELSHAMNSGDIGRVENTFMQWIYMFRHTGKHKYATHTLRMMYNLRHVYSAELAHVIRMNWLCNPTGKVHSFRGVDWMVERNNLYTKVIYGGSGSNRTIDRIIEESPLIELFRECHVIVENSFHLDHRTIRHAPPNMTKTLEKLSQRMEETSPHKFARGRRANYIVPDPAVKGMLQLQSGMLTTEGDNDGPVEVDEQDLGVE